MEPVQVTISKLEQETRFRDVFHGLYFAALAFVNRSYAPLAEVCCATGLISTEAVQLTKSTDVD